MPEDDVIEQEKQEEQKQSPVQIKNKMFDYLNKDGKRIKW